MWTGEDASFDVEFASRFRAKVIIVDPTPRAIRHFEEIQKNIGQPAVHSYVKGGKQPIASYDLRQISKGSLILEPTALWVETSKVKLFVPVNPNHVSRSIVNYQNNYSQDTLHIEVSATTLEATLAKCKLKTMSLMKLDIEGAEMNVIRNMLEKSIHARQLLVEFDDVHSPSERSKKYVEDTDRILRHIG